jgi:hypothetical protein
VSVSVPIKNSTDAAMANNQNLVLDNLARNIKSFFLLYEEGSDELRNFFDL